MNKELRKNTQGFIAFTSLLVISAVTLAIAMSVTLMGISSANSSLGYQKGQTAVKIGESCLEETLLRLRNDGNFSGVSLSVGDGSCITTVSANGNIRTIWVTGTITGPPAFIKILNGVATRAGKSITLNSWTETTSTTPSPTASPTPTNSPSPTPTNTPTPTPTNTPTPTPTNTPTPTPTNTPTPTPTPANCNQYCQQKYSLPGSCKKAKDCSGYNEGSIYECKGKDKCCCE
jgi:cell division septation protein DedD